MICDVPKAEIKIPPCWETVLQKHVLLVDGPMAGNVVPWFHKMEALVIDGLAGRYGLSTGGHFGVWEEPTPTSSTDQEPPR